jgi:hypothetical protein
MTMLHYNQNVKLKNPFKIKKIDEIPIQPFSIVPNNQKLSQTERKRERERERGRERKKRRRKREGERGEKGEKGEGQSPSSGASSVKPFTVVITTTGW